MNNQNNTVEKKEEELEMATENSNDCADNSGCGDGETDAKPETGAKAEEEVVDYQDKYLRLYAEFDNFRKRTMRERADLIRTASQDVLEKLLPLLDDFERAEKNSSDDIKIIREGMNLIHTKFDSTLAAKGLKPMEVKAGDVFNVDFHEAITNIPAPTPDLVGKIVDVVESGYMLGDKVLRYAKVVIGQ